MVNERINAREYNGQHLDRGLNLVGPTKTYLDSDFLRINHELAKKFERLNAGAIE